MSLTQLHADPVLKIDSLQVETAGRDSVQLLKNVSLEIRAGETVCLVGESGSGKSLTSLAAMGLLPPASLVAAGGRILLEGEDVLQATAARLRALRATRMSMVFQEPMTALNPAQKAGDQIREVLRAHTGLDAKKQRQDVLNMLESVGLPDVTRIYESFPHQLSGGQRQRIMIAMALILKPRLLIADEPTTALDVTTQQQILRLIRKLQQDLNTSVLLITHDMGVVADVADRVYVMKSGEVVEHNARDAILCDPKAQYTRNLLMAVPSLEPREPRPRESEEVVLNIRGLTKSYERHRLLGPSESNVAADAVDLSIVRGRTLGIVGESGSGKSSVARCVMRLVDPTSGSIEVCGQDVSRLGRRALQPIRKRIQMIFQDPNRSLNPRLTVGDSIAESPINFGASRATALQKARELLQLVGLTAGALDRHPHQFSGGQRQRIAIARALAMEPDVLVADEAVSALDVSVQEQVLGLLDRIQTRLKVSVLFITHDLRVAAQICDDLVVMHKGRVIESGPVAQILRDPKQEYTRRLMSAVPGKDWDFASFRPLVSGSRSSPC